MHRALPGILILLPSAFFVLLGSCAQQRTCCDDGRPVDPPLTKPLHYGRRFYDRKVIDPASLAVAANHFIGMGESRAVAALLEEDRADSSDAFTSIMHRGRRFLVARLIYKPTDLEPVEPLIGAPTEIKSPETPAEIRKRQRNWPYFPIVESRGVFFHLDIAWVLAGISEPLSDYLNRCRQHGQFRQDEFAVPNQKEALIAAKALMAQPKWRKLTGTARERMERQISQAVLETPE